MELQLVAADFVGGDCDDEVRCILEIGEGSRRRDARQLQLGCDFLRLRCELRSGRPDGQGWGSSVCHLFWVLWLICAQSYHEIDTAQRRFLAYSIWAFQQSGRDLDKAGFKKGEQDA